MGNTPSPRLPEWREARPHCCILKRQPCWMTLGESRHISELLVSHLQKGTRKCVIGIPGVEMCTLDGTAPNPQEALSTRELFPPTIGIVKELCFPSAQPAIVPSSLCSALSTEAKGRELVSHTCWWCRTQSNLPLFPPPSLPPLPQLGT